MFFRFGPLVFLFIHIFTAPVWAQRLPSPYGMNANLGVATARYNVLDPGTDASITSGNGFSLQAEKPLEFEPFFIVAQLGYNRGMGTLNYDFLSSNGVHFLVPTVDFRWDSTFGGFGIRMKVIRQHWLRPYVEGGLVGGYSQITYDNSLIDRAEETGSDYKREDGVLDFGSYIEVGFDLGIYKGMGLKVADRYTDSVTRPFSTLKNRQLRYANNTISFSMFFPF